MDKIKNKPIDDDKNKEETVLRFKDGSVRLRNRKIELMNQDILYHLSLGSGSHDLVKMFGDVKFVCMGGTAKRMESFANYIMKEINYELPCGSTLLDISQNSNRYSMYKVGPVVSVSHGMGISSLSILMHEMIKLMYHAKVKDPVFIRIGTCGGIGYEGGTVVITNAAVNGILEPYHEEPIIGKMVKRPAILDGKLAEELLSLANPDESFRTIVGKTMCTSDFYEGQGRLDGAFCDYNEEDKINFLMKLQKIGVVNIEMEATTFAALTHYAGIKAAIVCVTFLDRLKGDQVIPSKEQLTEWQNRPQKLVSKYISKYLSKK